MKSNGLAPRLIHRGPSFLELRQGQNMLAFAYPSVFGLWVVSAADIDSYFEETTREEVQGLLYEAAASLLKGDSE